MGRPVIPTVQATGRPEEDAKRLLDRAWRSDYEGRYALPIDPVKIARALGVQVFRADIENDVAGMLVKKTGQDPAIYMNRFDSASRQRFTCAHELGHYVRRGPAELGEWEYVDRRDNVSARGTDPDEVYANQFAAALLMPASMLRDLAAGQEVFELALTFGVSQEAMSLRLRNLGLRSVS